MTDRACLGGLCRRLGACEFADDEHLCTLEATLVQLGAKEVVMPKVGDPLPEDAQRGLTLEDLLIGNCGSCRHVHESMRAPPVTNISPRLTLVSRAVVPQQSLPVQRSCVSSST